jgi:acid phosphatase
MNKLITKVTLLCSFGLMLGCSQKPLKMKPVHDNLYSTLWLQSSAESKAHSYQAYSAAQNHLLLAINDVTWTASLEQAAGFENLPAAIILDVDETILDNAQFQAKMVLDGVLYDDQEWDRWVALQAAPAIPGAVEFINRAVDLGVEVFYITNRDCRDRVGTTVVCPQKYDTIENLNKVGIKEVKADNVMLKYEKSDWLSEKQSRREEVVKAFRVLMLVGDDLGDFLPHVKNDISVSQRADLVEKYASRWGSQWIVLSNPTYGSWMSILKDNKNQYLNSY